MLYLSEIYGPYAGGASMWSISTESGLHHQRPKKENILLHVQSPNRRYTSSKISILFFVDRWILYIYRTMKYEMGGYLYVSKSAHLVLSQVPIK